MVPENIKLISPTLDVSNFETSRVVREEQPENIKLMIVTWEVSKLDKSRVVREEQP